MCPAFLGSDTGRTDITSTLGVPFFLLPREHLINDKQISQERIRSWDPSKYTAFKQYNTIQYNTMHSVLTTDLSHALVSPYSTVPEDKL
jgi:hypothetical protein